MTVRAEFWSSIEYAGFQRALVAELRAAGLAAEERFLVPQRYYWDARTLRQRWKLRINSYGIYPLRLFLHFRRAPADTVGVVCSNPFYAPRLAMAASGARTPIIHWVFDLFPDVLVASGWMKAGGVGERALRGLVAQTFNRAAANVFLGENLLRHAEMRFGPIPRAQVIPVGADGAAFRDYPPVAPVDTTRSAMLTALYCGNLGRMHEIETFIRALPATAGLPIRFQIRGNGPAFGTLRAAAKDFQHVDFRPNLPDDEWVVAMRDAAVALVFLKDQAGGLGIPSKTYSALVAGQAVLAVCPTDSELADLVRRHDAGWVVAPGDADGLAATLRRIAASPAEVLRKRRNAWESGHRHYEQRIIAAQWLRLIGGIAATAST